MNVHSTVEFTGKEMKSHCEILRAAGKDQNEEIKGNQVIYQTAGFLFYE